MSAIEADLAKFAAGNAQVVGVSTDSVPSHKAYQKELGGLSFPLASDRWPYAQVAAAYGLFPPTKHPVPFINDRAVYIVDKDGKIAWSRVYDLGVQPDNMEILYALHRIS